MKRRAASPRRRHPPTSPPRRSARLAGGSGTWQELLAALQREAPDAYAAVTTRNTLDVLKLRDVLVRSGIMVSASNKEVSLGALLARARAEAAAAAASAAAAAAAEARARALASRKRARAPSDDEIELDHPLLRRVERSLAGESASPLPLREQQKVEYAAAVIRDAARMYGEERAVDEVLEALLDNIVSRTDEPMVRGHVKRLVYAEAERRRRRR